MAERELAIRLREVELAGELDLPDEATGLVVFAHGSGSSRKSPRNRHVRQALARGGMGTLLFDLLTPEEEQAEAYTRHLRFNIPFLAGRLIQATRWVLDRATTRDISVGFFGASTGAAAALMAAAELREVVTAVVSRGGRPDLAADALETVTAATLLIVGGDDQPVLSLNEEAYSRLTCEKALRIIPGATHLFEEPGALEKVVEMATEWFATHFQPMANRESR
jgi:pimeloyl-ACP methyl ester carboxylesterase